MSEVYRIEIALSDGTSLVRDFETKASAVEFFRLNRLAGSEGDGILNMNDICGADSRFIDINLGNVLFVRMAPSDDPVFRDAFARVRTAVPVTGEVSE